MLELPHGIPSHDTFGDVFARLDPVQLQNSFVSWTQAIAELLPGEVVAIDGKTARRSYDPAGNKGAIHLVSAWATQNNLTLGQVKTEEKSNEITAIPQLLEMLDLNGCIVTIDAMGCQREIAQQITAGGADYVLAVKENQGRLCMRASETCSREPRPGVLTGCLTIMHGPWTRDTDGWNGGNAGPSRRRTAWIIWTPRGNGPN